MKMSRRALQRQILGSCLAAAVTAAVQTALAADADEGRRLAQLRCVPCHIVAPNQRQEVADSPPFEAIARKFGSNADTLSMAVSGGQQRMNMTVTPREAADIVAYIGTLAK